MKFRIVYSEDAKDDVMNITNYISFTCKAPKTSKDFIQKFLIK